MTTTKDLLFGEMNPYLKQDDSGKFIGQKKAIENSYALQTLYNVPSSFRAFFEAVFMPVLDPVGFATGIVGLGDSLLGMAGITDGDPETAKAVGKYFADRYGSVDGFKEAFKNDPIGILSDVAVVATAGAGATVKGTALAGQIAKQGGKTNALIESIQKGATTTGAVASKLDPITGSIAIAQLPIVKNALAGTGKALLASPLALTTGKGVETVSKAFEAGLQGGKQGQSFKSQFLGKGSPDDIVNKAIEGLMESKNAMQKTYNNNMTGLAMSQKIVPDFAGKLRAIRQKYLDKHMRFDATQGKDVLKLPKGAEVFYKQVDDIIETAIKDTKNYTYGALDDVKKQIDMASPNVFNATNQNATDALTIRNDIKELIVQEMPDYADVMKAYEEANLAKIQIEKALKLGTNIKQIPNIEGTYRRLLSALNDGVNANFGKRAEFVNKIDPTGELSAGIAGANLGQILPSNIVSRGTAGAIGGSAFLNPATLALLPATSPAVVGGLAYGAGRTLGLAGKYAPYGNPSAFTSRSLAEPSLLAEDFNDPNTSILTYGMNKTTPYYKDAIKYMRGLLMGED